MSDVKPCPVCGEEIKAVAIKCRFCGEDLERRQKLEKVRTETVLYKGGEPFFYSVGQIMALVALLILFILPGLIYLLTRWYATVAVKYTITTQRLGIETGWLSKGGENVELFRVDDFGINTPFGMKLMGYGLIIFKASDRTAGLVQLIVPLDKQSLLAGQVRESIFEQREHRKIMTLARS